MHMLKSMTGYGTASKESPTVKYTVEIKSLNSKFLELNLRLPKALADIELNLRNESSKLIQRGKVTMTITAEYSDETALASSINQKLLIKYYNELLSIAEQLKIEEGNLFQMALNMPEVISGDDNNAEISTEEKQTLMAAFHESIIRFNDFRNNEGQIIEDDLRVRALLILTYLSEVEQLEPLRIPHIRERINQQLEEWVGKEKMDENRLEQEMIYYIDKLDITEEKVRLKSHCDYFSTVLSADDSNGKKLAFITQEMGREINTLGSKANNAEIQQIVVRMKEELEKIKEQLLNVL